MIVVVLVCSVFVVFLNVCECIIKFDQDTFRGTQQFKKCGTTSNISPLIVDGEEAIIGTFPWHAGIYYQNGSGEIWEQKCGGSLITNQFVLTAAHCVAGKNETEIRVALGKYFRAWDHYEVSEQKRKVSKLMYPDEYDEPTYYFDIALLLLDERITPGGLVTPVCTGILGNFDFLLNKKLLVAGWGRTENVVGASPSETLQYNDVTYVPRSACRAYIAYYMALFDKFCAMKNSSGVSIAQKGDSGGGLTVVHNGLHYIYGVVSVKLIDKQVTFFTNITWTQHIWWIENEMRKFDGSFSWSGNSGGSNDKFSSKVPALREDECELPPYPRHGVYKSVSCNGSDPHPACSNRVGVVVQSNWEIRYICDPGYIPSNSANPVCENGVWRNPTDCVECGFISPSSLEPSNYNGISMQKSTLPWLAVIYRRDVSEGEEWLSHCGGTLITTHIVLTEASCLTKTQDPRTLYQPSDFTVGLGISHHHTRVQPLFTVRVKEVIVPTQYLESPWYNHDFNIGLVDLEKSINITINLMPACVDWSNTSLPVCGTEGIVSPFIMPSNDTVGNAANTLYHVKHLGHLQCSKKSPWGLRPDMFCAETTDGNPILGAFKGVGYTSVRNGAQYLLGVLDGYHIGTVANAVNIGDHLTWLVAEKNRLREKRKTT